jgi:hypothetical protein
LIPFVFLVIYSIVNFFSLYFIFFNSKSIDKRIKIYYLCCVIEREIFPNSLHIIILLFNFLIFLFYGNKKFYRRIINK